QNYSVTCIVRKGSNTDLLPKNSNIIFIDYNNEKEIKKAFQNHEILIHLAAKTKAMVQNKTKAKWTIIRPSSVYGPGDKDFLQYFRLTKKHLSPLVGFKKKYLSLIYVDELTEFIAKTIGNEKAFNEIFFASDGQIYCWEDFATDLSRAIGTFAITFRIPEFLIKPFAAGKPKKHLSLV
ncbi:MAG: hypothetical protein B6D62_03010, partial [Candidatus Cloacimonas sp. 4484_275]